MTATHPDERPMLHEAIEYLRAELPVFPVCSPLMIGHTHRDPDTEESVICGTGTLKKSLGKIPLIRWRGYQKELPSEDDVRQWWKRWPNANIGFATGNLSGILVLDTDGTEAQTRCLQLGGLDDTPTLWTGKIGGAHFHLEYPGGDVRNFAGKMPGIDLRGEGGYALLPPSLHASGNRYRWIEHTRAVPPSRVPQWLATLIEENAVTNGDGLTYGDALNLDDVLQGVKEGKRDDTLFRYACRLRHDDVLQEHAEALIRLAALACDPPFSEAAAIGKVRRAYKEYPPGPASPEVDFDEEFRPRRQPETSEVADSPPAVFLRPISELLGMPEVDPDWLVDQLFTVGSNGWVAAEPKIGKSWVVLELAYALSTGTAFLGRFSIKQPRRVVYVQEEDSLQRVLRRLKKIIKGDPSRGTPSDDYWLWSIRVGFKLDSLLWMEKLRQEIIAHKAEVVILDVFNRLHSSDDSKQQEMTTILNNLTLLTNDYGCAFIIVHHNRKTQQGNEARGNQMMRGSGVLAGWSECSLYLRKSTKIHTFIVTPESKDAPEIDDFTVTLTDLDNGGVILNVGVVSPQERTNKLDGDIVKAAEKITKEGLDATIQRIADLLGKERTTVGKRMKGLVEEGLLDEDEVVIGRNSVKIFTVGTL